MKKVLFLGLFLFMGAMTVSAQTKSCSKEKSTCTKKAAMSQAGSAALMEAADVLAKKEGNIEKRTCAKSGKVSYYQKATCEKSGKMTLKEVKYCEKSKAFVNVSPSNNADSNAPMAPRTVAETEGKKQCSKSEKKACAKDGKKQCSKEAKKACAKEGKKECSKKDKKACCKKDKKQCSKSEKKACAKSGKKQCSKSDKKACAKEGKKQCSKKSTEKMN